MKKMIVIILFLLLAAGLFAADPGIRVDVDAGPALSLFSVYLNATPAVMYDFGLPAVGIGLRNYIGLSFGDIYTAPHALVELGWFYAGFGASFMLKAPNPETNEAGFAIPEPDEEEGPGFLPFLTLGIAPPLVPLGPGKLGLDIYADFLATASPVVVAEDPENPVGSIIGTIFITAITAVYNMFKFGVSVTYSVQL